MEYVVGPVLTLLLSMKFADWRVKQKETEIENLTGVIQANQSRIELVETKIFEQQTKADEMDKQMLRKVMTTVTPIANAVVKLNKEIGIQ